VLEQEGLLTPDTTFPRATDSEIEFQAFVSPEAESSFVPVGRNSAEIASRKELKNTRAPSGDDARALQTRFSAQCARRVFLRAAKRIAPHARSRLVGVVELRL
jgi:hypothetical protein